MNKKTFLFMFLALSIAIIFSGTTAATNNNNNTTNVTVTPNNMTTNINSSTNNQEQTDNSTNTSEPDPYNTRTNEHYATIQAAISASDTQNGDTIIVEAGTYTINTAIIVGKSINIIGTDQSNTIINAQGLCSIFTLLSGVNVNFSNLTLENALGNGAIYSDGTITVTNCTFTSNTVAINNNGALTVTNCTFTSNTANNGILGGSINNSNGPLNVIGSIFTDNSATNGNGGAISVGNGIMTITNSTFTNNSATYYGGAIWSGVGSLTITNCTFTGNTVTGGINPSGGGAIANDNACTLTINNCTFIGNTANNHGGAIYNYYGSTLNVNNSTFTNNMATNSGSGGAIENDDNGILNVSNSTFNSNTANFCGGIYNGYGNLNVTNSTFTNNTATAIYGGGAGAIYSGEGSVNVTNSTFANNTAQATYGLGGAGAIYSDYGSLTVNNSTFTNNTATGSNNGGGAIYNNNGSTLTVNNSTFTNNTATGTNENGGAINTDYNTSITNTTFTNNNATLNGGAIYYDGVGITSIINNDTFTNNTANQGGAIYINGNEGVTLTITGSTFTGNIDENGGAIYNDNGAVNINFNRIFGNSAPDIYSTGGSVNATDNWWGTNFTGTDPITAGRVTSNVNANPWIVLNINANPTNVVPGGSSTVTADLLHDNTGAFVTGVVPYTGLVNFATSLGSINNAMMSNGVAESILNAGSVIGLANVSATADSATVYTLVNVTYTSVIMSITDNTVNGKANPANLVTFTITLYNNGPYDANNVLLQEILPMGLQYWSSPNSDISYNHATRTITWTGIGTLPATGISTIRTFLAQVSSPQAGTTVTTYATEHNFYPGISTANDSIYINNSPVNVTVTDNTTNGEANANDLVTYTITLHNYGPDPAQNVYLKVMPMSGLNYVSSTGGVYNSGTIIWNNLGTIASGANLIETFITKINVCIAGKNTTVKVFQKNDAQYGGIFGNDTIYIKKSVLNMTMTNNATNGIANVGDLVTYTIILQNNSPDSADNVTVKNAQLNGGLSYVSSSGGVYNPANQTIVWNIDSIPSGGEVVLTFTVQVKKSVAGKIVNVTAAATQTGYSTNPKKTSTLTINP